MVNPDLMSTIFLGSIKILLLECLSSNLVSETFFLQTSFPRKTVNPCLVICFLLAEISSLTRLYSKKN